MTFFTAIIAMVVIAPIAVVVAVPVLWAFDFCEQVKHEQTRLARYKAREGAK